MTNERPPADILGMRPGGERRAGAAQLVRVGLGLLRHRALRAWLLAVLTLAILFWIMQLAFTPFSIGPYIIEDLSSTRWWWTWGWPLAALANIIAGAPFLAAFAYALLLLLQRRRAGAETLFSPFRSAALWANTVIASSAALLVPWLIPWLWRSVPWSESAGLVAEDSPLAKAFRLIPVPEWLIHRLPHWIGILLAIPLAWSALNVLVLGDPGVRAIARSARLSLRHWRLAALYLAAAVLLPLADWVCVPLADLALLNKGIAQDLIFGLYGLCNLLVSSVILPLETLVLVLVYREMIWREREAGQASATPLG